MLGPSYYFIMTSCVRERPSMTLSLASGDTVPSASSFYFYIREVSRYTDSS